MGAYNAQKINVNRRIHSVKANSHGGNICVYVMTTQKDHSRKILSLGSQKCAHFAIKFRRGPQDQERAVFGLRIYL